MFDLFDKLTRGGGQQIKAVEMQLIDTNEAKQRGSEKSVGVTAAGIVFLKDHILELTIVKFSIETFVRCSQVISL